VSTHDWLLFLHVLSAFLLVGAEVFFTFLIFWLWRTDVPSDIVRVSGLSRVGSALVGIGAGGVLLFGIILAFEADSYAIWDPWIVAALILWAAFGAVGSRVGRAYDAAGANARELVAAGRLEPSPELGAMFRSSSALNWHLVSLALVVLLLLDMIFKPWA
jgi:Predicted integral membrane protein (DUF2269)